MASPRYTTSWLARARGGVATMYGSEQWEWLRGTRSRRGLVVVHWALSLSTAALLWLNPPDTGPVLAVVVLLVVCVVTGMAVGAATYGVTEIHPQLLDERQQRVHASATRSAYRLFGLLLVFACVALLFAAARNWLTSGGVTAVVWLLSIAFTTLPASIAAWKGDNLDRHDRSRLAGWMPSIPSPSAEPADNQRLHLLPRRPLPSPPEGVDHDID